MSEETFIEGGSYQEFKGSQLSSTLYTCPCHKMYREEAFGLALSNYTFEITIFMSMYNLGQFCKSLYFKLSIAA